MGIVDYLSREHNGEAWPDSELDERFVVASIENFHKDKLLDNLNSRLIDTDPKFNVKFVEHSGIRNNISHCKDNSTHGCYGNQFVQKLDKAKPERKRSKLTFSKITERAEHTKQDFS